VQNRLNLSICCFDCGLEWAEGCTSSIIFARWRQCALVEGHVAVTRRITLNHPCTAAMGLMANYFDHLLSLDTPTYTVARIAKRFEPTIALWAFHTIQPSSFILTWNHGFREINHQTSDIGLLIGANRPVTRLRFAQSASSYITPPTH